MSKPKNQNRTFHLLQKADILTCYEHPIEQAWSNIKQQLRSAKARTVEALESAIADALAAVTPHHAAAWFAPCGYAIQ